jgi:hypothetical protein
MNIINNTIIAKYAMTMLVLLRLLRLMMMVAMLMITWTRIGCDKFQGRRIGTVCVSLMMSPRECFKSILQCPV